MRRKEDVDHLFVVAVFRVVPRLRVDRIDLLQMVPQAFNEPIGAKQR